MRMLSSCLLLSCLMLSGCKWLNSKPNPAPPTAVGGAPKADNLVSYLNRQADLLATIQSEDVDLTVTAQGKRLPGLRCFMVCEKPRSFRLTGAAVGTDYVDIGSNNDQFWFWVKDGEAPPLYYCSYVDYEKGVKLPLPFQPEWVVQALGMAKYDPNKPYKIEAKGNTYELIEETTIQGMPVKKITIFNARNSNDPAQPQVLGHVVQDAATGKIICQATIRRVRAANFQTQQGQGTVFYPSDVQLEWPSEQLIMTMKIGRTTVNQKISNEEVARYFSRPNWDGLKKIDLAHLPPSGNPTSRDIRQTGDFR
jgi:hypothetical protein